MAFADQPRILAVVRYCSLVLNMTLRIQNQKLLRIPRAHTRDNLRRNAGQPRLTIHTRHGDDAQVCAIRDRPALFQGPLFPQRVAVMQGNRRRGDRKGLWLRPFFRGVSFFSAGVLIP
ncbi:Uncharacterised protein [Chlamydia trachomatis]|nr:Uncharacterised protein [Chlamydia trachomatis]